MESIHVNVNGKDIEISRDAVSAALKGAHVGQVRTHAVLVDGVLHPVKKAFAAVTGIDVLDFNTVIARKAFTRLGFKVVRESE
jgi:hypothetical protein